MKIKNHIKGVWYGGYVNSLSNWKWTVYKMLYEEDEKEPWTWDCQTWASPWKDVFYFPIGYRHSSTS